MWIILVQPVWIWYSFQIYLCCFYSSSYRLDLSKSWYAGEDSQLNVFQWSRVRHSIRFGKVNQTPFRNTWFFILLVGVTFTSLNQGNLIPILLVSWFPTFKLIIKAWAGQGGHTVMATCYQAWKSWWASLSRPAGLELQFRIYNQVNLKDKHIPAKLNLVHECVWNTHWIDFKKKLACSPSILERMKNLFQCF